VVANLVRPLLLDVARLLERAPERLIMSGLLREEADEVAAAFERARPARAGPAVRRRVGRRAARR
jgi:ribosomal protein L11 methylase PrmA